MLKILRYSRFVRTFVFTLSVVMFMVFTIGDFQQLIPVLAVLSIIAIILSIPFSSLPTKIFSSLFLMTGTWFVMQKGIDPYHYIIIYGDMLYLLSFFAMLPLLTIPLKLGNYDLSIQQILYKNTRSVTQLHRTISSISFLLSSFLNLATIPIMYYTIKGSVEKIVKSNTDKFLCLAIIHGYALSVAWSPFSGAVAMALETTGVSWSSVFYKLFMISIVALLLNWMIYGIQVKQKKRMSELNVSDDANLSISDINAVLENKEVIDKSTTNKAIIKLLQIVIVILMLIFMVIWLTKLFSFGLVVSTTIMVFPFAFIWSLALKKGFAFMGEIKSYAVKDIPDMADQFAIFLSTGFFVQALQYSGYNYFINEHVLQFNQFVGSTVFLSILPLIVLGFGFIGMHPITAITLLAESMNPSLLGISAEHLAIALVGGAVMTFTIGPFSGTLNMFSILIHKSTFRIASWNVLYTFGFFLLLVTVLFLF
jgi:hypothetical protein